MADTASMVAEVRVYAAQLSRAADGASYVQDGYVRVKDPAFLVWLMEGMADAIEADRPANDSEPGREFREGSPAATSEARAEAELLRADRDAAREVYLGLQQSATVVTTRLAEARAEVERLREALTWFVDREAPIQFKFNLHGPEDTAAAMMGAFRKARAALQQKEAGE